MPWLKEQKSGIRLSMPRKIPEDIIKKTTAFFRAVYQKFGGSEAIVILYWSEADGFQIKAPIQKVEPGALPTYKVGENPEGLIRVGTIHSHGSLSAFHSKTDKDDEEFDDGVHITIGNVNFIPSSACSIVCDGERMEIPISSAVEIEELPDVFPAEWLEQVSKPKPFMPVVTPSKWSKKTRGGKGPIKSLVGEMAAASHGGSYPSAPVRTMSLGTSSVPRKELKDEEL
jgi:hypothetical protein